MMFGLVTASCQKWPPAPSAFASRRKKPPTQCAFCKRLTLDRFYVLDALNWLNVFDWLYRAT